MAKAAAIPIALVALSQFTSVGANAIAAPILGDMAIPDGIFKFDINQFTAVTVLAWYAWHNASRVVPGMVSDYQNSLKQMATDGQKTIHSLISDLTGKYEAASERERLNHNAQLELLRARIHDMANQGQKREISMVENNEKQWQMVSRVVDELRQIASVFEHLKANAPAARERKADG